MTSSEQCKAKNIIIAEPDRHRLQEIQSALSQDGFSNLHTASDGAELRNLLKQFQEKFDHVGLLILNHALPDCPVIELCQSLASEDSDFRVPIIVLVDPKTADDTLTAKFDPLRGCGVILVERPLQAQSLLPLIELALVLKQERDQNRIQQERTLTELAEHKILEARLKYLILHDELTGVGNRRSLEQTLQLAIHHCQAYKQESALLYIDVDRFNVINDLEGHDTGDRLLVELVNLIRQTLSGKSAVARIGADEFCLFLPRADRKRAVEVAEAIRTAVNEFRFLTPNDCYHISVSIGITLLTPARHVHHPNELIAEAHQACFIAKTHGRNLVNLYDPKDMAATHFNDVRWVPKLRDALKQELFFLVFQPVIRLNDGLVSHYEVLLRMRDEEGQIYTPDVFIPVAERMGLIHSIDMWVIDHVIDFLAALSNDQAHLTLTVNLSGHAFHNPQLLPFLEDKLQATWITPKRLIFEITETAAIANFAQTRAMIAKLHALGCSFALDDFGTGFNSFEYLKNIPVDYIKIDGQFVQNLSDDATDRVLVRSMVEIAHTLDKKVIAEYVESSEVLQLLNGMGVDYVQGFLFGKPQTELLPYNIFPLDQLKSHRDNNLPLFHQ